VKKNPLAPLGKDRIYFLLFCLILILAVGIRLKFFRMGSLWPDEALYGWYAKQIFHNPFLIFSKDIIEFHPPLFSVLLSLGHFLFPGELACRFIVMLINLTGIIGIYILGVKIRDRFLGVFCALCLSFHFIYLTHSFRILPDGVLTVFLIYVMIALLNISQKDSWPGRLWVGIAATLVILLKWTGLLVIPIMIGYYFLAFPGKSFKARYWEAMRGVALPVAAALFLLINNYFQLGSFLPDVSALKGAYLVKPFWYYATHFLNIIIVPFLIPLFFYGAYQGLKRRDKKDILLLLMFAVFISVISFTPEKDLRYSLVVIPVLILISGTGLWDILSRYFKSKEDLFKAQCLVLLAAAAIFVLLYPRTGKLLKYEEKQFTGFSEAGAFLKKEIDLYPGAIVLAGSPRIVRYYSGINFKESGGNLMAIPSAKDDFLKLIRRYDDNMILIIDNWEKTQPAFVYPLTAANLEFLSGLGFRLTKTIRKEIAGNSDAVKDVSVIWIFLKDRHDL